MGGDHLSALRHCSDAGCVNPCYKGETPDCSNNQGVSDHTSLSGRAMTAPTISHADIGCEGLPPTRAEAASLGVSRYFTGVPCKNGHIAPRKTKGCLCVVCNKNHIRNWRRANAARVNELCRERYAADLDASRSRRSAERRNFRKKYPEKSRELDDKANRLRRAKKNGAEGSYSLSDLAMIRKAQRDRCGYCRVQLGGKGHADHITPLSKGGGNFPRNIQLLCKRCNTSKRADDPIVFAQRMGLLI